MSETAWVDVAGGKLTTYRLMAEQTVDRIGQCLGLRLPASLTDSLPIEQPPNGISGLIPPDFNRGVVRHCCMNEWAIHLDDLLVRRTSWSYYRTDHASIAAQTCAWMAEEFGWTVQRRNDELERYRRVAALQRPVAELHA